MVELICQKKEKYGRHLAFNPGRIQLSERRRILPLLKVTDILIVNQKELSLLLGKRVAQKDLKEALKEAVGLGPKIVAVTLGKKGSLVYNGAYFFSAPVYPAKVLDSLGCGDAYSSAFLAWFIKTGKIEEAILAGTINSASVVSQEGTTAGLLTPKVIAERIKEKKIEVKKEKIE